MMSLSSHGQACDTPTCSSIGEMRIFQGTDFPSVVGSHIKRNKKHSFFTDTVPVQVGKGRPSSYCDSLIKFNSEKDLPATAIAL